MKFNKIAAGAVALLAVSFASCSEGQYWDEPTPSTTEVSFPKPAATISLLADDVFDSYEVTVVRVNGGAAESVNLNPSTTATDVFTSIPSTADFAAGSKETTVKIGVNTSAMGIGTTYTLTLTTGAPTDTIIGGVLSPAANNKFTFKISKNYTWKNIGWMEYTDDFIGPLYGLDPVTYWVPVEAPEQAEGNGIYRLINPYGAYFPYNEPGDYSGNAYLEINVQNPDRVSIPMQEQNLNWGHGKPTIGSIANYFIDNGSAPDKITAYYGKFADGKVTLPVKGGVIIMGGSTYYANNNGLFCLNVASLTTENPYE